MTLSCPHSSPLKMASLAVNNELARHITSSAPRAWQRCLHSCCRNDPALISRTARSWKLHLYGESKCKIEHCPKGSTQQEFKTEAARLGESVGAHEAARRLGVPVATLGNWKRRRAAAGLAVPEMAASALALPVRRPVSELEAENSRLRRELADAKLDVEILRKAGRRTLQRGRDEVR